MSHVIQGYFTRDARCHVLDGFGIKGPPEHDVACEQVPDWVIGRKQKNQEQWGVPSAVCLWG